MDSEGKQHHILATNAGAVIARSKSASKADNESDKPKISGSDLTRRMVCGGLAGMFAKVSFSHLVLRIWHW